jgi:hypothetical protein
MKDVNTQFMISTKSKNPTFQTPEKAHSLLEKSRTGTQLPRQCHKRHAASSEVPEKAPSLLEKARKDNSQYNVDIEGSPNAKSLISIKIGTFPMQARKDQATNAQAPNARAQAP